MHIRKKSCGRPRQHRPTVDLGTQELQQKRKALLGTGHKQGTALAESLLGILYGRQLISQPLYEAGRFFGELGYRYEPCLGYKLRPNASSLSFNDVNHQGYSPLSWSDQHIEKRTEAWRKALNVLRQAGPEPYKTVLKVVFYDQDLYATPLPYSMISATQLLCKGLESLEVYFRVGSQGTRGRPYDLELNSERSTIFPHLSKELRSYFPA